MTDTVTEAEAPGTKPPRPTKTAIVTRLLSRPRGASLGDITAATGWQAHSIRSFLTGLRKKDINLLREQRRDGTTSYRIGKAVPELAAGE
jgi:hypothetical protein